MRRHQDGGPVLDPGATPADRAGPLREPGVQLLAEVALRLTDASHAEVLLAGTPAAVAASVPTNPLVARHCAPVAVLARAVAVGDVRTDALPEGWDVPDGVRDGSIVALLAAPVVTADGRGLGNLSVCDTRPRTWEPHDVRTVEGLARSVAGELELPSVGADLALSGARLELAVDAAALGTFDSDVTTGRLVADDRLVALYGYDADTWVPHVDSLWSRIHPDDAARVREEVDRAGAGGDLVVEFRVRLPDGRSRWVLARGRRVVVAGRPRMLGVAWDTTEAHDGRTRVARVLETVPDPVYVVDAEWRFTYVNAHACRLLERGRDTLLGRVLWEEFPHVEGTLLWLRLRQAVASGLPEQFEEEVPHRPGVWTEVRAFPGPDGLLVYLRDVSRRRRAEQEAEAVRERERLVADISRDVATALEPEAVLRRLLLALVPRWGDWAGAGLVGEGGSSTLLTHHADPVAAQALAERTARLDPGEGVVAEALAALARGEGLLARRDVVRPELAATLQAESLVAVPLQARDRVLGVLFAARDPGREQLTSADVALVADVGRRAGLAVDNAVLYSTQRAAVTTMQRSLLTPLPQPERLEVAGEYLTASESAQVGGDWYDAFVQPDGSVVLSLGDAMGHDLAAAAAMGQVRTLLRGIAYGRPTPPQEVLRAVDEAMEGLAVETLATAVVARLDGAPQGEDETRRMTWSAAGHPPPVVLRADGTVEQPDGQHDLLLGLDPRTPRRSSTVELRPGDAVLVFTDGLVERRGRSLDEGVAALVEVLRGTADVPLPQLCADVVATLLPQEREDDVALLAVRLHPRDLRPEVDVAGWDARPL